MSRKHLLRLGPGGSEPQADQMEASSVHLVVPSSVHESYTDTKPGWL
ncbi:type II restriction endonuclease [Rhodovulum sulfidophilum]|nr:hypothetical protein [Rhodovulum sulfidophilum]